MKDLKGEPEVTYKTVLMCPPSSSKKRLSNGVATYENLTPWVKSFSFGHTYYSYIYVFYMFVFAFYKGYALSFPKFREIIEIFLIMALPWVQHVRFFFGYWGMECGMVYDLAAFLSLCTLQLIIIMYFLMHQAYIMTWDVKFLTIAVAAVVIESTCGTINMLQTLKLASLTAVEGFVLLASAVSVLTTASYFLVCEIFPTEIQLVLPTFLEFGARR